MAVQNKKVTNFLLVAVHNEAHRQSVLGSTQNCDLSQILFGQKFQTAAIVRRVDDESWQIDNICMYL